MKAILILACIAVVYGSPCSDLSGSWRNELGSNMTLVRISGTLKVTGTYSTAVESSRGAATFTSNVTGMVQPVEGGAVVAFNVLWNNGASLTAWVGQCLVCNGKEQLYTTWVLRSLMPSRKRWMTTRINQDTFYRVQDAPASPSIQEPADQGEQNSEILGQWIAENGNSLDFSGASNEYKRLNGVNLRHGVYSEGALYGQFNGNQTYTALGFVAAHEDKIRGWTGHIYNPQEEQPVIETSWLSHEFSEHCNNPRKEVEFGMDNYAKN